MENPYVQYMYSYPHKTAYRRLEGISLKEYLPYLETGENSLYVHIPFCQYKCGYCNLFSLAGKEENYMESYVDALELHASQLCEVFPEKIQFQDLTLGGGTPLLLPARLLDRVFEIVKKYFRFSKKQFPVVVETSPNQTTREKLEVLKRHGVSRVSIGVQSFQEEELKTLHRFHSTDTAIEALNAINKMDFECLNIDLIYGIPGQTLESLKDSMKQALEYQPEELFVYPLYIKPDTPLQHEGIEQSKETFEMYKFVRNFLQKAGYVPCSMRRFVRKDRVSQKAASELCGFGNTISLGCGGRSYIGNLHFCTPYAVKQEACLKIVEEYINKTDYTQISHGYVLSEEEQKRRYVIKHILFDTGIHRMDYQQHFKTEVMEEFPLLKEWEQSGYLKEDQNRIWLTSEGFALSDFLGPQLISKEVRGKMEAFK